MLSRRTVLSMNARILITAMTFCMLWSGGCKQKGGNLSQRNSDPAQVAAYRQAAERGMKPVAFEEITQKHVGKKCAVTVATPSNPSPPPPPLGMVRVFGDISVYTATLDSIGPEELTLSAKYPSGTVKKIAFQADQVEAIAVRP